ncbi:MAG: type II secretion system protein GspG [Vicinamibacterales bacterium]|nr:type II secretion system protein GspG [Vicinamibacterales bacterium]
MTARRAAWTSERGLSLVEVTIMLVILLILAGTLVPVMSDSVNSARLVRARNDLSQLAVALVNFQRDIGPLVFEGRGLRQVQTTFSAASTLRPVALLVSDGVRPELADRVPVESAPHLLVTPGQRLDASTLVPWSATAATDVLDYHLRMNGRGYADGDGGPGSGWNGPYLTKDVPGDPWGRAYLVNTAYLRGLPPSLQRCARCAVFVLSAGPNGLIETPFEQPIANAHVLGDDLAVRIQ